ncbi:carboxypeptidase-like regulatory domain-containing protein [Flagellimonas flava]|uniref:CarboxypepD_reg-like domain-containing protein n=1 Tax=Flagellimonas flava TaxID=570519 RepID=A0A1M5J1H3_9FLAO|nr:carboxypeptidase-like regulatory domain-containing protein [Allomuricauda flava]SHG34458.1 CarboxypepD_reg-like domain-containing protein [Allomuricauda flava]
MKRNIVLVLLTLVGYGLTAQVQVKKIKGIVTDGLSPLSNVNISIKDSDQGVKTDKTGRYEIYADEGQVLVYSYVGKQDMEIMIQDVTRFLNVEMFDKIEELDEVTVTKRSKKSQVELFKEYQENKSLIKTGFGILDREKTGYSMRILDGDDLSSAGQDFIDGLQAWIPGAQVFRPNAFRPGGGSLLGNVGRPTDLTIPIVYLPRATRSAKPVPAVYEVDGVLFTDAPVFLSSNNIERIAVIESIAGIARYGSLAAGGVVIINTKTGNYSKKEKGTNKPFDQAKLRNNFWDESQLGNMNIAEPSYMVELKNTKNKEETEEWFETQQKVYANSPYFYLDVLSHFNSSKEYKNLADEAITVLESRFANDPRVLKALAYQLDAAGAYERANEIYKQVFILRPHYAQSYLDLSNSYRNAGNLEYAATLYARYNYLVKESFFEDSESFSTVLDNSFNNLITQHGNLIGEGRTAVKVKDGEEFKGTRVVFEWNNSEAEFDLQFVNPENQYYTWNHTLRENSERIMEEKKQGFSCQEYLIYKPIGGTWRINAQYLGNKSLTPTYLKATVYHNFNTAAQQKEIHVFKLSAKNNYQSLFSIDGSNSMKEQ